MHTDLLSPESPLFDAVSAQDTNEVGNIFHNTMLASAREGYVTPNTLYVITPSKIGVEQLDGERASLRFEQALQAGRDFSAEFGRQPLFYLVHQVMSYESSSKEHMPNDDPMRTESCWTFVSPLLGMCLSRSIRGHMNAIQNWNQRAWCHELHEGLPIKKRNENSLIVSITNNEKGHYDKTETNIMVIDNSIISQCIIGLSPSFPGIHISADTPIQRAISLELMKKTADALYAETYP
ncbi:hypothetical protein [Synechococcus sp. WH 8016]|uniref:hypothetical protein n=1 Tax=Synechococcus sp. WH 8016 TaxID=166318 RepID=UPI00022D7D6C|nr:hypothetical protein [Synechococcus sp. WH 8016]EHA63760.1 hypothetical protein Syn8016DRAFT_0801 [Synechococcus sp. WH 8016]